MSEQRATFTGIPQLVVLLGVILAGLAVWELVSNLTAPLPELPGTGSEISLFVTQPQDTSFQEASFDCEQLQDHWRVTVQLQQLDVEHRAMDVALLVCPGSVGDAQNVVTKETVPITTDIVKAVVDDTAAGYNASETLASPALIRRPYTASYVVPLVDRSEPYPSDAYSANLTISMRLPGLDERLLPSLSPNADLTSIPIDVHVQQGPALNGFDTSANQDTGLFSDVFGQVRSNAHVVHLLVRRTTQHRVFVYAMATAPAILVLMLFHLFVLRRMEAPEMRDVLLGMTGVFLALLPLRGVLVPSEVAGVTRVDLILATELAALVLVVGYAYGRSVGAIPDLVTLLTTPPKVTRPRRGAGKS